jgi:hypothetical protein
VLFPGCRILAAGPSRLIYALDFVDFFLWKGCYYVLLTCKVGLYSRYWPPFLLKEDTDFQVFLTFSISEAKPL